MALKPTKPKADGTRTSKTGKSAAAPRLTPKAGASAKSAAPSRAAVGWREETLDRMRTLIMEADPEMIEERKWKKPSNAMKGVPVWSHNGMVCTGETYAKAVKLTFARGASLPDPARLFNSSLEGNTRRAIDIHEGEKVNARAFKAIVKAAVAQNEPTPKRRTSTTSKSTAKAAAKAKPGASKRKPARVRTGA